MSVFNNNNNKQEKKTDTSNLLQLLQGESHPDFAIEDHTIKNKNNTVHVIQHTTAYIYIHSSI